MPKSYESIVAVLETMEQDKLTIEFVKARLLDEYNKQSNLKPGKQNSLQHQNSNINVQNAESELTTMATMAELEIVITKETNRIAIKIFKRQEEAAT